MARFVKRLPGSRGAIEAVTDSISAEASKPGFAPGCRILDTTTGYWYENQGTMASATWNLSDASADSAAAAALEAAQAAQANVDVAENADGVAVNALGFYYRACTVTPNDPETPTSWTITLVGADRTAEFPNGSDVQFYPAAGELGEVASVAYGAGNTTFTVATDPGEATHVRNYEANGLTTGSVHEQLVRHQVAKADLATLALTTNGNGASLIGLEDAGTLLAAEDVEAAIAELALEKADLATLALTTNGNGASLIGIEDAGTLLAAEDVEAAIAELATEKADLAGGTFSGGVNISKAGSAAAETALSFLDAASKGLKLQVLDCNVVFTDAAASAALPQAVPAGSKIVAVQMNNQVAATPATAVKAGLGTAADPNLLVLTADLSLNTKTDGFPLEAAATMAAGASLVITACDTNGDAAGTLAAGTFRVRIYYFTLVSLANAA